MATQQPYTTENPEVREVQVEKNEESVEARVSPARPDYALDFSDDAPLSEVRVTLDEQVGPNDPNAVIVPPEGRGELHTASLPYGEPSPEALLASGDAAKVESVRDGKVVEPESDKS